MKSTTIKILALLLTACVFLGVTSCSLFGGDDDGETTETTIKSAFALQDLYANPDTLEFSDTAVIEYFNALMTSVNTTTGALNYSSSYNFGDFNCENATLKANLPVIVKLMKGGINDGLGAEVAYGEKFADLLPAKGSDVPLVLKLDDILKNEDGKLAITVNADAHNRYNEVSSKAAEEASNYKKEEDIPTTEYVELDEDVRKITIALNCDIESATNPAEGSIFCQIFKHLDKKDVAEKMASMKDYMIFDGNYSITYEKCEIYMEINRITNEVIKVEFKREIRVTTTVTGVGKLASVGEQELTFLVSGNDTYEFNWEDPEATTVAGETTAPAATSAPAETTVEETATVEETTTAA